METKRDQRTRRTNENDIENRDLVGEKGKRELGLSNKVNTPVLSRSDSWLKIKDKNASEKKSQLSHEKPSLTPTKREQLQQVTHKCTEVEAAWTPEDLDLDFSAFEPVSELKATEPSIEGVDFEEWSVEELLGTSGNTESAYPDTVEYGPPKEKELFTPEVALDIGAFDKWADLDAYELCHSVNEDEDFFSFDSIGDSSIATIDDAYLDSERIKTEFGRKMPSIHAFDMTEDSLKISDDEYYFFQDAGITEEEYLLSLNHADLGRKINSALTELTKAPVIDEKVLDSLIKQICAALLASDVNVMLVQKLRSNIKNTVNLEELANSANKKRLIEKAVMDELSQLVDPKVEPYKPLKRRTNIFMMVGLQGAGKTTTCTKIASFYQRKGWKVALVCADTFRAGAFDQLKQNATKAKIPYYGSYTETDPVTIAAEGVEKFKAEKFEIIIVDTSGRHKQETELFEEMKQISSAVNPDTTIFVMDGSIGQAAESQAKAFKEAAGFGSIIITKMDGHAKGGGAISAVAATNSPIIFLGVGEHIQDMDRFEPKAFIRKILGVQDMRDVIEQVQDNINIGDNKKLMKNIEKVLKRLQIMGAIPGMPQEMMAGAEQEGGKRIKRMMCIMDSMTDEELDGDDKVFKDMKRVVRVARGSGTTVCEVQEILFQYTKFAEMVKSIGGKNGLMQNMKNMQNMDPRRMGSIAEMAKNFGMNGNPNDLMAAAKQMGNMFGGGRGGGGGGMPNMADLMKAMKF
ncbi:SRP54-type protein [Sporodiniella umbellata]|nr:SRP54-type protein [Sporodiniella umbellata]